METTTHTVPQQSDNHSHTIILLHGRDSIASEFACEFFESQAGDGQTLPQVFPTFKWVFPASRMRNSARFESDLSQWFDIWSVEEPSEKKGIQIDGLRESIEEILDVIRGEALLVPQSRIILGGISQGCATAIHTLLYAGIRLGGFVGFCSWLPFQEDIAAITASSISHDTTIRKIRSIFSGSDYEPASLTELKQKSQGPAIETPVFLSHLLDDNVVPIQNGRELKRTISDLGFKTIWKEYEDGGHWINESQGVDDVIAFLKDRL
ncbi:alpha/beta-hydrolase [Hyaloscypha variabilis]